ncbi:hypothetical protein FRC11_007660 [Ceratobasidium sp. 423]|nr:hypothetical protein FRC11_007660 [Ceratobasidium sp. 423]
MSTVHPIWGRQIDKYACSFTLESVTPEFTTKSTLNIADVKTLDKARGTILEISKVGVEEDLDKIKCMAGDITLGMLQSVNDITSSRDSFPALADPQLVRGCVKLMSTVASSKSKPASPFSYEYGYICFRILTISFGLCLAGNDLDTAFKAASFASEDFNIHPLRALADIVASAVGSDVQMSPILNERNILDEGTLIIPAREGLRLFNILWGDRKLFLEAMLSTYVPALTGVLYMLWRLWRIGRKKSNEYDLLLGVPLYEILRRYCLGVTRDQDRALSLLITDSQCMADLWLHRSKILDVEDSKTLLRGYIHRVTSPETWHGGPSVLSLSAILEFVVRFAQPGADEPYPQLFIETVGFLWGEVHSDEQVEGDKIGNILYVFHCLMKLLDVLPNGAISTKRGLVEGLTESDLVCFIARLIVLRRSAMEKSQLERDRNQYIFATIRAFFDRLRKKIPRDILRSGFDENLDDWMRYRDHLMWCCEMLGSSEYNRWYCNEQYALYYDELAAHHRIKFTYDLVPPAEEGFDAIFEIAQEEDESKIEILARQITLQMLRSVMTLSFAASGLVYYAHPLLIRGCIRLMRTVRPDQKASPFAYEYGYLCFNIAKLALGVCLLERSNLQCLARLVQLIDEEPNDSIQSILTGYLSNVIMAEIADSSTGEECCDWMFGWVDPPTGRDHSKPLITKSDALDLINVLWEDRKLFFRALLSTYTPGASIILLLFWQYMRRECILKEPPLPTSLVGSFLDLTWRFTLAALPNDYVIVTRASTDAKENFAKWQDSKAVDGEDSRNIINAYIKGIPSTEGMVYRQTALAVYRFLPYFVLQIILPGTEDLFPQLVGTILGRLWDMVVWEELDHDIMIVDLIGTGLLNVLDLPQKLEPQSPVILEILEKMVQSNALGLVGFAIQRLDPTKATEEGTIWHDSSVQFRTTVLCMATVLVQAVPPGAVFEYFYEYVAEWLKHVQHNDFLLGMADGHDSAGAVSSLEFRRQVLWDVIAKLGQGDEVLYLNRILMQIFSFLLFLVPRSNVLQSAMPNFGLDDRSRSKVPQGIVPKAKPTVYQLGATREERDIEKEWGDRLRVERSFGERLDQILSALPV